MKMKEMIRMTGSVLFFKKPEKKKERKPGHPARFLEELQEQNSKRVQKADLARRNKNKELVERMNRGEEISLVDKEATWWPKRPPLEKDKEAMKRLYGEEKEDV